ncbi:flavin monoamine oxidase family protein [Solirhodobacter olei]|uniref:flavin monoamine oxidase family protein n=1 Tax=Solirhodobacter olei TaxID=2493082 RepID=UPI0019D49F00|nr:FAD-dependent oxidoreductase [Solirhodobacter olei]
MSGYISGDELERISVQDYAAYDAAASDTNWRLPAGYGALVTGSLPPGAQVHLGTPVQAVRLETPGVVVHTTKGALRARAIIVTVSTNVLSGDSISWPVELSPWREAAADLPLGNDEKLYFEILGEGPFEVETYYPGDLRDPASGAFYIRPQGKPVVECFLGGAGARRASTEGAEAAFARAMDQLRAIYGSDVQRHLKPLIASNWTTTAEIGGGYSHALPGKAEARRALAQPFDDRVFFAGEATHRDDFSTAHGALLSGLRAGAEVLAASAMEA